jgi:hypothetical protein
VGRALEGQVLDVGPTRGQELLVLSTQDAVAQDAHVVLSDSLVAGDASSPPIAANWLDQAIATAI